MELGKRLNRIIAEKEKEIRKLKKEIKQFNDNEYVLDQQWKFPELFKESDLQRKLPFPRLEMRLERRKGSPTNNWSKVQWIYGLVYKHYGELGNDQLSFIPISKTEGNTSIWHQPCGFLDLRMNMGKIERPLRDGVHIISESKVLGIPAFLICEEMLIVQEMAVDSVDCSPDIFIMNTSKMVRK